MQNDSTFCPDSFLGSFLTGPVEEFLARPKKNFRGDLVKIGHALYSNNQLSHCEESLNDLSRMIEWIHSGSLIIDDIQDDSHERRGEKSLHHLYGMPCALNAANWMYFEALKMIHPLKVKDSTKLRILFLTHHAMAQAHQGQTFDLMAHMLEVPREVIFDLGMKSHELKSGVLLGLALQVGALLADENADVTLLGQIGNDIGTSLQRFDDIGNVEFAKHNPKCLEDLRLGRPSWIWMYLSKYGSLEDYQDFKKAVTQLPDNNSLKLFFEKSNLRTKSLAEAKRRHQNLSQYFQINFPGERSKEVMAQLQIILEKVEYAYT